MWFPEQKHTVAVDKILYRIDKKILYGRKNVFSMYTGQKSHGRVNRFFFFLTFLSLNFQPYCVCCLWTAGNIDVQNFFLRGQYLIPLFSNKAILFWNLFCVIVIWSQLVAVADPGFLRPNSLCLVERSLIVKRDLSFLCSVHVAGYRPQTKLREGNVFTPVCHSVHRGGSLSGGYLSRGVSVRETPPYGNERAVRILLECILVVCSFGSCPSFIPFGKVTRIFSLFFFKFWYRNVSGNPE